MSLNLFFMYCAASSCWAGLQATISEHLRTSSGPRGRQQRPHPAGQMQHSPGNVWSSSVRVGDKIKESGVNLTWKKNEIEIIATIYLIVSKSLNNQMQLPRPFLRLLKQRNIKPLYFCRNKSFDTHSCLVAVMSV